MPSKSYKKKQKKSSKRLKVRTKKVSKKTKQATSISDDFKTSKDLSEFRDRKSISITSRMSDLKETSVGELTDNPPIHTVMLNQCIEKISRRRYLLPTKDNSETKPISKTIANKVCSCIFEKNKALSINELEDKVLKKMETPASQCITILDKNIDK